MSQEFVQGQDVTLNVSRDGKLIAALSSITSFRFAAQTQTVLLQFLGQRSPKIEMNFNGYEFSFGLNHKDPSYFTFVDSAVAVAQHRTPGIEFSIGLTVRYPSGEKVRALLRDVGFDALPFDSTGRLEFATAEIGGKAASAKFLGAGAI